MVTFFNECDITNQTSVRERLKAEITTLTDRQVEYVLSRLQDVQDKEAISMVANQAMQQPQWQL